MDNIKTRDGYVDTMRGLAIVSVILIHTAFCFKSNSYCIDAIKNLTLLFDVPVFFFLAGFTMSIKPDIDPIKQMAKLTALFFWVVLFCLIIFGGLSVDKLLAPFVLARFKIEYLPVVSSSYWFVPVYIVSLIYSVMIVRYFGVIAKFFFLIFIPLYYLHIYLGDGITKIVIMGSRLQTVFYCIWLMLLGETVYKINSKKLKIIAFTVFILSLFYSLHGIFIDKIILQEYKFPFRMQYIIASLASIALVYLLRGKINNKYLSYIGQRALYFYLSQGIGASVLSYIMPYIKLHLIIKLPLCFIINLILSVLSGILIIKLEKNIKCLIEKIINWVKVKLVIKPE